MRSQASAISNPPPMATPFTAAITGLVRSKRVVRPAKPDGGVPMRSRRSPDLQVVAGGKGALAGAGDDRHPLVRVGGEVVERPASSSKCAGECSAFITSGRFRVTVVIGPSRSTFTNS